MQAPPIRTTNLCKTFDDPKRGAVHAVCDLNLECKEGEIFGLLGPNGAGKTTTLRMLSTILAPTSGEAELAGIRVSDDPLEVRRRLGFLSGSTGLYPRLTAREILEYFGRLHGMDEAQLQARVEDLLDTFSIRAFADGRCESLSTGQRQRVSIARAVLHDPPVLILDEPTTGLDILAASDMIQFIQSRKDAGTCVLFSTHILSEAERLCDRIGVIDQGRLLAVGSLEELRAQTGKEWLEDVFRALVEEVDTEAPAATPPANEE
ncbi:MAG: ATP-binding cassette domain-containing protein [Planctomycetota bacterium]|jgi:sodium transport system ATP-binding protein|nr:ABC transporter ATP-binding protein [Candidatus Woesearchaeota archaeon]MDP6385877.1 ATP-binding cassette domain-containing protein [Planctomycetota bacterium]MDP6939798.1 ATP-binding cassette domain-containing protein [Planctomycetota bacterium]